MDLVNLEVLLYLYRESAVTWTRIRSDCHRTVTRTGVTATLNCKLKLRP